MALFGMIIGGGVYGFIIGNLVSIVSDQDANTRIYHERMGAIISYMDTRGFPSSLQRKVKRFYRKLFQSKSAMDEKTILADLPNKLKNECSMFLVNDTILSIDLFCELKEEHMARLTALITPIFYEEEEQIIAGGDKISDLVIFSSGSAMVYDMEDKALGEIGRGECVGHEAMRNDDEEEEFWSIDVYTTSQCEVMNINIPDLRDAFSGDPVLDSMEERANEMSTTRENVAKNAAKTAGDEEAETPAPVMKKPPGTKAKKKKDSHDSGGGSGAGAAANAGAAVGLSAGDLAKIIDERLKPSLTVIEDRITSLMNQQSQLVEMMKKK